MQEAEIWGVAETGDGYMIFIRPLKSEYTVPIFIGQLEAQAILIGFGGVSISRPITADLLKNVINETGLTLLRIEITELKDKTFYGRLNLKKPSGEEFIMDSRPSDALALAVRFKCRIFIDDTVVKDAGILTDDLINSSGVALGAESNSYAQGVQEQGVSERPVPDDFPFATEAKKHILKAELNEAVETENYERAAEIRDILNLLEK